MRRAEEMRAVFARFEGSGLTLKAFGEREEISYTTLVYWRKRLRALDGGKDKRRTDRKPEAVTLTPFGWFRTRRRRRAPTVSRSG